MLTSQALTSEQKLGFGFCLALFFFEAATCVMTMKVPV